MCFRELMAWPKVPGSGRNVHSHEPTAQDGSVSAKTKSRGAAAVQQFARRFKQHNDWCLPRGNEFRIQAWYQPIVRSAAWSSFVGVSPSRDNSCSTQPKRFILSTRKTVDASTDVVQRCV